ncbi:unnamed protein product [Brassica rapa subsp. narinosa]
MAAKQILYKGITRTIGTEADTKERVECCLHYRETRTPIFSTASILPRLVWYIWNRNDKCFNNKDTSAYSSWLFKSHMFQHTAGSVKWMLHGQNRIMEPVWVSSY